MNVHIHRYAQFHPQATVCHGPDGRPYDRVKILQDIGFWVDILGQPITDNDLVDHQPYIASHIHEDGKPMEVPYWKMVS